ncbi:MAG: hypothetical protein COT15_03975, partial [Candidatus Diapherotrites archaeon CG08_land_8_20_14_0_20_34_12]
HDINVQNKIGFKPESWVGSPDENTLYLTNNAMVVDGQWQGQALQVTNGVDFIHSFMTNDAFGAISNCGLDQNCAIMTGMNLINGQDWGVIQTAGTSLVLQSGMGIQDYGTLIMGGDVNIINDLNVVGNVIIGNDLNVGNGNEDDMSLWIDGNIMIKDTVAGTWRSCGVSSGIWSCN